MVEHQGDPVLQHLAELREPDLPPGLRARVQRACLPGATAAPTRRRRWPVGLAAGGALAASVALVMVLWSAAEVPVPAPQPPLADAALPVEAGDRALKEIRSIDRALAQLVSEGASSEDMDALWAERAAWAMLLEADDPASTPVRI